MPSGIRFEVSENLREDIELFIGRSDIGAWKLCSRSRDQESSRRVQNNLAFLHSWHISLNRMR